MKTHLAGNDPLIAFCGMKKNKSNEEFFLKLRAKDAKPKCARIVWALEFLAVNNPGCIVSVTTVL